MTKSMNQKIILLFLLIGVSVSVKAQIANYQFTQSTNSYTEISGGTILGTSTNDDNRFENIPISFPYIYNGTSYTTLSVNANGFVQMAATSVQTSNNAISNTTTTNAIAVLSRDLKGKATGSELMYKVEGSSPNQVMTIQWKNYKFYGAADADCSLNFQIKLYETSNKVDFVYGVFTQISASKDCEIGLRGATNADFNNRTTTNWTTITAGTVNTATCTVSNINKPTSGLTFTWEPPSTNPPSVATLISPLNQSIDILPGTPLQWISGGGVVTGYKLFIGTTNPPTTEIDLGLVTSSIQPLDYGTTYYWMIKPYNSYGTQNTVPVWSFTTISKIALPYVQNFDQLVTPNLPIGFNKIAYHPTAQSSVDVYTSSLNSTNSIPHSAPNYAVIKNSSSPNTNAQLMMILPPTDTLLSLTRLRFYSKLIANGAMNISVGTITNPRDASTFTEVQAIDLSAQYTRYTVNLSSYAGIDKFVAIRLNTLTYASSMVLIDDIEFEKIPTGPICTIAPTSYSFGDVNAMTTATSQPIEIKNSGIGTLIINSPADIFYSGADSLSFNISIPSSVTFPITLSTDSSISVNLLFTPISVRAYNTQLKVNSNTGVQSAQISGNGIAGFVINTFPYVQNFETDNGNFTAQAISGTNQWEWGVPNKATHMQAAFSGSKAWVTKLTPELPSGNNPLYDHNSNSCLYLPRIDFTGIAQPKLTTYLFIRTDRDVNNELGADAMILEQSIDGGLNWSKTAGDASTYNYNGSNGSSLSSPKWAGQTTYWSKYSVPLTDLANNSNVLLRFRFVSDNNSFREEGIGIDDIRIYDATNPPNFNIDFYVSDGVNPIQNATININSTTTLTTDVAGHAVLTDFLEGYANYIISKTGLQSLSKTVYINGMNEIRYDTLVPLAQTYSITFSITANGSPTSGATVLINGQTYTADNSGIVTVTNLPNGVYPYSVMMVGYNSQSGTATVNGQSLSIPISLTPNSIEEPSTLLVDIYPNPCVNSVKIINPTCDFLFEIYNSKGVLCLTSNKPIIDLTDIASGIYFYRIVSGKTIKTGKLIKE